MVHTVCMVRMYVQSGRQGCTKGGQGSILLLIYYSASYMVPLVLHRTKFVCQGGFGADSGH